MTERKCKCGMFFIPVVGNQDECQSCMISPRRRVEGDPARDISEKERARIKSNIAMKKNESKGKNDTVPVISKPYKEEDPLCPLSQSDLILFAESLQTLISIIKKTGITISITPTVKE